MSHENLDLETPTLKETDKEKIKQKISIFKSEGLGTPVTGSEFEGSIEEAKEYVALQVEKGYILIDEKEEIPSHPDKAIIGIDMVDAEC